jgi:hypothetical protein
MVEPAKPDRLERVRNDHDPFDPGPERPHDDAAAGRVSAEHAVRVVMIASDEPLDLSSDRHLKSRVRRARRRACVSGSLAGILAHASGAGARAGGDHRLTVIDVTGEVATTPELERTAATKWTRVPARMRRRSAKAL